MLFELKIFRKINQDATTRKTPTLNRCIKNKIKSYVKKKRHLQVYILVIIKTSKNYITLILKKNTFNLFCTIIFNFFECKTSNRDVFRSKLD